jgi:DNA-binding CsgD family transcriptional regulator
MSGLSNGEIASRMEVGRRSVKAYVEHLYRKFEIPVSGIRKVRLALKLHQYSAL